MAETESKKRKLDNDGEKGKRLATGPQHCKMLVHNHVAGTIIGTGGSVLAELESATGCVIRLSRPGITFPGTNERILVAGGQTEQLHDLIGRVVEKQNAAVAEGSANDASGNPFNALKIVLPNSAVSMVIGRGGEVVRVIQTETGARVSVGDRVPGFQERVCIIKGTTEQMVLAGSSVMDKIQPDDNVSSPEFLDVFNVATPAPAGGTAPPTPGGPPPMHEQQSQQYHPGHPHHHAAHAQAQVNNVGNHAMHVKNMNTTPPTSVGGSRSSFGSPYQFQAQAAMAVVTDQSYPPAPHRAIYATVPADIFEKTVSMMCEIPDVYMMGVLGDQRSLLNEMSQKTSCRMEFLNEKIPGQVSRTLEICGPLQNVHVAHVLVLKRVSELEQMTQQYAMPAIGYPAGAPQTQPIEIQQTGYPPQGYAPAPGQPF